MPAGRCSDQPGPSHKPINSRIIPWNTATTNRSKPLRARCSQHQMFWPECLAANRPQQGNLLANALQQCAANTPKTSNCRTARHLTDVPKMKTN